MQDSYLNRFFCVLIFIYTSSYRYFELSDRPSFIPPQIDEFRGIPRYRVNSIFMNGFRHPVLLSANQKILSENHNPPPFETEARFFAQILLWILN